MQSQHFVKKSVTILQLTTTTTGRRFVYPLADFAFLFILAATHLELELKKDEDNTKFSTKQLCLKHNSPTIAGRIDPRKEGKGGWG